MNCCKVQAAAHYQTDWIQKGISEHKVMWMKCQKDINILGKRESRKCYIYSVEKAAMIAQMYASAMLCHCNRHMTLLLELILFLKR